MTQTKLLSIIVAITSFNAIFKFQRIFIGYTVHQSILQNFVNINNKKKLTGMNATGLRGRSPMKQVLHVNTLAHVATDVEP